MSLDLLPPLDLGSLLGLGGDPGAAVQAGQQQTQDEIAQRNVLGNPGGTGGLLRSLIGIGPDAATLAAQAAAQKAQAQQAQINAARNAAMMNPSAQNFSRLFLLDPASKDAIKAAHDALDAEHQRTQLEEWSALRGYAAAGDTEGFKARAQRQIDADRAAGIDTADEERALAMADQPQGLKAVGGFIDSKIAAVLGPEKWAEAFKPGQEAATAAETARHNQAEEVTQAATQAETARHNAAAEAEPKGFAPGTQVWTPGATGGAAPAAASGPTPAPTGGVYDQVGSAAATAGASPEEGAYLRRLAQVESRGDPRATNGSSTGVFQFHPTTFDANGGGNINDVGDQTKAALHMSRADRVALQHAGVPRPSDADLYVMHQQGPAGGLALLTAPPDVGAVAAITPAYRNPNTALAAIAGNIGLPYKTAEQRATANARAQQMTAGQFRDLWNAKWSGGKPQAQASPAQASQSATAQAQTVLGGTPGGWHPVGIVPDPSGEEPIMSDGALTMLATRYIQDGKIPPFGMGKNGTANRNAFYERANDMMKQFGLTPADLVANTVDTKALSSSVTSGLKLAGLLKTSEETLGKNIDVMLNIARQGGVAGSIPVFNRWIQAGRKAVVGDPQVTALNNAVDNVANESAALMTKTTGTGGGQTSEAAIKEAHERFDKAGTLGQLEAAANIARIDGHNRVVSTNDMVEGWRAKLRAGPGGNAAAASAAAAPAPAAAPRVQPNSAQITMLKSKPNLWKDFDAKFGPGASSHILNPDKYGPLP